MADTSVRFEVRRFLSSALLFVLLGLALYAAVYAASEALVYRHARHNRFFMVNTAPRVEYDHVILGASHAAVFDYRDLNAYLEKATGSTVINLSIVGAGVTVNRLLLDYFLEAHRARTVVYVLDSFAFYSRAWNEERLTDARLFRRAPFDVALARLLFNSPAGISVFLNYVTAFAKVNDPDRFEPETRPEEGNRFDRSYRPVAQLDQERIEYLYPLTIGQGEIALRAEYLAQLEALIAAASARDIRMAVVRPPIPARIRSLIPGEDQFDAALRELTGRAGAELHDFSQVANDEKFFYDTDHLNRSGVLNFFDNFLARLMRNQPS